MSFLYALGGYLGYFIILIIFLIVAIILAKKKSAWILYFLGAVITLFSLIGNQKRYSMWGLGSAMTMYWIVYFSLLIVAAIIIVVRNKRG